MYSYWTLCYTAEMHLSIIRNYCTLISLHAVALKPGLFPPTSGGKNPTTLMLQLVLMTYFVEYSDGMHEQSMNHVSLKKGRTRCMFFFLLKTRCNALFKCMYTVSFPSHHLQCNILHKFFIYTAKNEHCGGLEMSLDCLNYMHRYP